MGGSSGVVVRTVRRRRFVGIVPAACLAFSVLLCARVAWAHPGGLAADGCHNHRASGTCHCHRAGASRPGCESEFPDDAGGGVARPAGDEASGADRTSTGAAGPPAVASPPAPAEWIRIATWNLNRLHWRTGGALWRGAVARGDEDYRTLARYARVLNADVVAFQEVNGPRAAARVFPLRDYDLHFSGRYDSRYDDIYNGFAVRKGRFDRVVKRDHESLGLGSTSRYQFCAGASTSRSRRTVESFACSTSISSRSASARASGVRAAGRAGRSLGRSSRWRRGLTLAGAKACRSWCWGTSTARWTATGSATTCGPQSPMTIHRESCFTACRQAATSPAGEARHVIFATPSTSSCSARGPGSEWMQGPSGRWSGPTRTRTPVGACLRITVLSRSISSDWPVTLPRPLSTDVSRNEPLRKVTV